MSDPVTNIDIEDVLSSIRRLVSEGDRGAAPRPAVTVAEAATRGAPERFVLTPALRIVGPEVVESQSVNPAPAQQTPLILTNHRTLSQLEATIAELEAAVTRQDGEFEPDGSEEIAVKDRVDAPLDLRRRVIDDIVPAVEIAPVPAATAEPEPESMFRHAIHDDTDDDHQDDLIDEDDQTTDELTAYLDDDSTIDENALRDMVVQIVRAELQGELGERITRNVRKLVRREIYRVINSQEFE